MRYLQHESVILFLAVIVAVDVGGLLAQNNEPRSFSEYALSSNLKPDEVYTVELLIDHVRSQFDDKYWDNFSERDDARRRRNYKPHFATEHVQPAADRLQSLSWLSFQRLSNAERPIRDLSALKFLPNLTGLVLTNNQITDLSPLAHCTELKRLHLGDNPLQDLSPLAQCKSLEELTLGNCPVSDLSALEELPVLYELSISVDQIAVFKQLKRLPHLRKLEFDLGTFDSFEGFPEMPELRVIRGAHVNQLDGLEKFPRLQNLVNVSGQFDSLEPIRNLRELTHANFHNCSVDSLQPLAALAALRVLRIGTTASDVDLSPLEMLPLIHEVNIVCGGSEPAGLSKLRGSLSSWDNEFRGGMPRHKPSLELEVVDKKLFDVYDSERPFNVVGPDANEGLLESELEWLDGQLEDLFKATLRPDHDYALPFKWNGARSRTIVLYSDKSLSSFSKLVLDIQNVLSNAKQDWIIYLQSDGVEPEFIVWVYPNKIMVTHEHAEVVRKLIDSKR